MLRKLWSFIRAPFAPVYRISRVSEKPECMNNRTVYLIGEDGAFWAAVFVCPCGCRAEVWLNLLKHKDRPTWTIEAGKRAEAHITPSVWRQVGCKSHFFIKRGRLIWAKLHRTE
jgi:hypothetical protein